MYSYDCTINNEVLPYILYSKSHLIFKTLAYVGLKKLRLLENHQTPTKLHRATSLGKQMWAIIFRSSGFVSVVPIEDQEMRLVVLMQLIF